MGREDAAPNPPAETPAIGPALVEARTEKGLSLADVEQATKIRKRYLEGLERDDYTVLPDAVYTQGFLKTYANYLGLDGLEISNRLKTHRAPRRERQISKTSTPPSRNGEERPLLLSPGGLRGAEKSRVSKATLLTVVISVVVLATVIGTLYYVGRGSIPSVAGDSPQQSAKPQENPSPTKNPDNTKEKVASDENVSDSDTGTNAGANANAGGGSGSEKKGSASGGGSAEASPDNLRVEIRVKGSASWISVLTDGEVAFNELGDPGFARVFEADSDVSVSVGNAGAVSVEVNGQDAGVLGEPGEVLTRNFTKKAAG